WPRSAAPASTWTSPSSRWTCAGTPASSWTMRWAPHRPGRCAPARSPARSSSPWLRPPRLCVATRLGLPPAACGYRRWDAPCARSPTARTCLARTPASVVPASPSGWLVRRVPHPELLPLTCPRASTGDEDLVPGLHLLLGHALQQQPRVLARYGA